MGDDGDEMTLKLPMKDMLFPSKDENRTDICILPIFSLGDTQSPWIIGSIITREYYQVFDLTDET